ncbi:MAG: hypothetical protein RSB93_02940 [Rikenellaceae bacterium]
MRSYEKEVNQSDFQSDIRRIACALEIKTKNTKLEKYLVTLRKIVDGRWKKGGEIGAT